MKLLLQCVPAIFLAVFFSPTACRSETETSVPFTDQIISQFNKYKKIFELPSFLRPSDQDVKSVKNVKNPSPRARLVSSNPVPSLPSLFTARGSNQRQAEAELVPGPLGTVVGKLNNFLAPKLLPLGFVRLTQALALCESKGRELVGEALETVRVETTDIGLDISKRLENTCRGYVEQAERECTARIEVILESFNKKLRSTLKNLQEECSEKTEQAVAGTRAEQEVEFKQMEKTLKAEAEAEYKARADEEEAKARAEFEARGEVLRAEIEAEFRARGKVEQMKIEEDFARRAATIRQEGEDECTDMIKVACGANGDEERVDICEKTAFFAGDIDDDYDYDYDEEGSGTDDGSDTNRV